METEAFPAGWGTCIVRVPYAEGTLVIDLRDPAKLQGKLDNMVKKSFDKYPPKIK